MDTIDCIKSRHCVRKFLPNKIPEPVLYEILDAANSAPCAGNIQSWRFLIVEDEDKKKIIAKAMNTQMPKINIMPYLGELEETVIYDYNELGYWSVG